MKDKYNQATNCAGFALGVAEWLTFDKVFNLNHYDEIWFELANQNIDSNVNNRHITENILVRELAEEVAKQYGYHIVKTTPEEAPEGTVAIRIGTRRMRTDFHFIRKDKVYGEEVWLHKPGELPIDMMFNYEVNQIWCDTYDSDIIFLIKN